MCILLAKFAVSYWPLLQITRTLHQKGIRSFVGLFQISVNVKSKQKSAHTHTQKKRREKDERQS